jgi:hypothetical protein
VDESRAPLEKEHKITRNAGYNLFQRADVKTLLDRYRGHPQDPQRQKHSSFLVVVPFLQMFIMLFHLKKFHPSFVITFDEVSVSKLQARCRWYFKLHG